MDKFNFEFAVHPGKVLKEDLKAINMTQKELAKRTGINKTIISELIHGKRSFTIPLAMKLADVFELPASYWCNMQNVYDETIIRMRQEKIIHVDSVLHQNKYIISAIKIESEIYNQAV